LGNDRERAQQNILLNFLLLMRVSPANLQINFWKKILGMKLRGPEKFCPEGHRDNACKFSYILKKFSRDLPSKVASKKISERY
jgi:hypothetical protein